VRNINGWSDFSDIAYIYSYSAPDKPPVPRYFDGTATSVRLQLRPAANDNGIRVVSYELEIDQGNDSTSEFRLLTSYSQFAELHTLTQTTDSLGPVGTVYRVRIRAVNAEGIKSEYSNECLFKFGPLPSQPAPVEKNDMLSDQSSIYVEWTRLENELLPILGYRLYADSGKNDDIVLIYDGSQDPQTSEFRYDAISNNEPLNTKFDYRFRVAALNFNGEGPKSQIAQLKACTAPSDLPKPLVASVSSTSVSIQWQDPRSNGGCQITSFALEMRRVDESDWVEVDPE